MECKSSIECGIAISAVAPGKQLPPFKLTSSAALEKSARGTTPTSIASTPTSTLTRASSMLSRSLQRRSSWLSSSLSSDSLPFAVIDIENGERQRSLRSMALSIGAAIFYSICAISMNFTNKAALMVFPFANTLLLLQMLAALAVIIPLRMFGVIYFPPLNAIKARSLMPLTVLYAGNVSCALLGLRVLNVPMYSTLKRLTPLIVLLTKWRMTKDLPSRGICFSVFIVVLGCFIAGYGDLAFDLRGYTFAFASCMLQAAYLLLVERTGAKQGVSTSELLAYNALLSLPFILIVMILSGEAFSVLPVLHAAISQHGNMQIIGLLLICSLSGVALNFSMFLCTLLNSALTTTIVGALKGVIVTALGFFLLGGVKYKSALNIFGIAVNAFGGTLYSVVKYRARLSSSSRSSSYSRSTVSPSDSPDSLATQALFRSCSNGNLRNSPMSTTVHSPSLLLAAYSSPMNSGFVGNTSKVNSIDDNVYVPSCGKPLLPPKTGVLSAWKTAEAAR
ncbi:hypothetical protein Ndes2526B_g08358 [Nannochloris sp. 'desiccata']|nr:hypothetical protein KSW81_001820 [Chlorella desiccata (nom. nud.)]KAH7616260.1 putative UDP-galactose/UDP-glucose transporter 7 [Chlorella desiccata (nom. nud.)]